MSFSFFGARECMRKRIRASHTMTQECKDEKWKQTWDIGENFEYGMAVI